MSSTVQVHNAAPITFSAEFLGRAARKEIGERCLLVLDPERRTVDVFTNVGPGVPERVYNARATTVPVPADADLNAVEEALKANIDTVAALFEVYAGAQWNGQTAVGTWGDPETHAAILDSLADVVANVPMYTDAGDYFAPAASEIADVVLDALVENGGDLDMAVATVAGREVDGARGEGYILDHDETERAIERISDDSADVRGYLVGLQISEMGLTWHVMPEGQGQIVEEAYATGEDGITYCRTTDKSLPAGHSKRETYMFSDEVVMFEPWNNVVGDEDGDSVGWEPASAPSLYRQICK